MYISHIIFPLYEKLSYWWLNHDYPHFGWLNHAIKIELNGGFVVAVLDWRRALPFLLAIPQHDYVYIYMYIYIYIIIWYIYIYIWSYIYIWLEDHDHPFKKSPTDESHISTISQRQKRGALHAKSKRRALHWYFAKKTTIRCYVRPGDQKFILNNRSWWFDSLFFQGSWTINSPLLTRLDGSQARPSRREFPPYDPRPTAATPQVGMPLLPAKHGIHVNDKISNNRIHIYIYIYTAYMYIHRYVYI